MFVTKNPLLLLFADEETEGGGTPEAENEAEGTEQGTPQEGNDDAGDERDSYDADRIREKIRKLNSENKNLREAKKAAEEKAAAVPEYEKQLADAQAENLRLRVGARLGLPEALIDRLKGSSEEEILKDAEALLDLVSPKRPMTGKPAERLRGGTEPAGEPEETDPRKLAARVPRM